MKRWLSVALFMLVFAGTAYPKFREDDQQYLDGQFSALQRQIQTLSNQVQTLTTQLNELRQSQAQLQAVIIRQQHSLQDIVDLVTTMRLNSEESFSNLKTSLTQLRTDQQKGFAQLSGTVAATPAAPVETAASRSATPAAPVKQGYVTEVKGTDIVVDLPGLTVGSHLVIYKAADPNTRVGMLEVTQSDSSGSHARVVTLNSGVQLEFSDIVRAE